jgi:hypothetical protein
MPLPRSGNSLQKMKLSVFRSYSRYRISAVSCAWPLMSLGPSIRREDFPFRLIFLGQNYFDVARHTTNLVADSVNWEKNFSKFVEFYLLWCNAVCCAEKSNRLYIPHNHSCVSITFLNFASSFWLHKELTISLQAGRKWYFGFCMWLFWLIDKFSYFTPSFLDPFRSLYCWSHKHYLFPVLLHQTMKIGHTLLSHRRALSFKVTLQLLWTIALLVSFLHIKAVQ